jgi:hypothetical protein
MAWSGLRPADAPGLAARAWAWRVAVEVNHPRALVALTRTTGSEVLKGVLGCGGLRWDCQHSAAGCDRGSRSGHSAWSLIRAAIAGWRRSLSRQRPRVGPMLPTGMPNLALIWA